MKVSGRLNRRASVLLLLVLSVLALTGCQGVLLLNKTNQAADDHEYRPERDIFLWGAPYIFRLKVDQNSPMVPRESIRPYIVLDGVKYEMGIYRDWFDGVSRWAYQTKTTCPDLGRGVNAGFDYYFSVEFDDGSSLVKPSPVRIPSEGVFHSKVFGANTLHFDPRQSTVNYSGACIHRDVDCVPSFNPDIYEAPENWPGRPSDFEHELTLRNLSQKSFIVTDVKIVSGEDGAAEKDFELVGVEDLPVLISCEDTFSFKIRYRPGYEQSPEFTQGRYRTTGRLQTWVEGPGGKVVEGPYLKIDYEVIAGRIGRKIRLLPTLPRLN